MENNEINENNIKEVTIIPYKQFTLTQPINKNEEIALTLNNISAKISIEKNKNGKIKNYIIELLNKNGALIGSSENGNLFKADLEIISSLIENQEKKLEELGLTIAGINSLDNQKGIETYLELYNREIITMNKVQKEEYDKFKNDYESSLKDIESSDVKAKRDQKEKLDKNIENMDMARNIENAEHIQHQAEQDLGFEISKITPIEDSLFYENNTELKGKAFFIIDNKGNPQITYSENGKFKLANGFKEAKENRSRIPIMTNDDQYIEEKIIYGSIESKNGASYAFSYGDYGTPELIEIRNNPNGGHLKEEKQIGRKVQTPNSKVYEINREGTSNENITRRTFRMSNGYTSDGTRSDVIRKMEMINEDRKQDGNVEDITPEDLANNIELRIENAFKKINDILKKEGKEPNSEETEKIKNDLRNRMEKDNIVFDDEEVEKYANTYITEKEIEKQQQEDEDKEPTLYNTHKRPWM